METAPLLDIINEEEKYEVKEVWNHRKQRYSVTSENAFPCKQVIS